MPSKILKWWTDSWGDKQLIVETNGTKGVLIQIMYMDVAEDTEYVRTAPISSFSERVKKAVQKILKRYHDRKDKLQKEKLRNQERKNQELALLEQIDIESIKEEI